MTLPSINLASGNTNNIGRSLFKINPDITNPREVLLVDPLGTGWSCDFRKLRSRWPKSRRSSFYPISRYVSRFT